MRAVLTYHSIDPSGSPVSLPEEAFRAHVGWLASGRVRPVHLQEILDGPPEEDAVAVTFDDGLESFGRVAAPLLLDAGIPVTLFVVSDRVGTDSDWRRPGSGGPAVPTFELLSWERLGALAEAGVQLGAHTRSHADLRGLAGEAAKREMRGSCEAIEERTGIRPKVFAYPYGRYDEAAVHLASRIFELSVTADLDVVRPGVHRHRVPRLDTYYYRDPRRLDRWGRPSFLRHVWLRRQARRARSLMAR